MSNAPDEFYDPVKEPMFPTPHFMWVQDIAEWAYLLGEDSNFADQICQEAIRSLRVGD